MVIGINQDAYRVDRANWKIFSGLASVLPSLASGDGLPAVAYKCAVTLSTSVGHTDVTGSITIGSEMPLSFNSATRKTTTVLLSALPIISHIGLNCNILIEALSAGGANIQKETATATKCRFMQAQKAYQDGAGTWTQSKGIADTTDPNCNIGDEFRFGGIDYQIGQVNCFTDLAGTELYRRLYLQ